MTTDDLNLREQITRIDQMLADIEHKVAEHRHMNAEIEQAQADRAMTADKRLPRPLVIILRAIALAMLFIMFFTAGATLVKLFG